MITILGAGLAGISASYHIGHESCVVFERNEYCGGHIHSYEKHGCIWDEGPHVSFTKSQYVRKLFEENTKGNFLDYPAEVGNYFRGQWIPHPAQTNLFAVDEPLRTECLEGFLSDLEDRIVSIPHNYEEWLIAAFGKPFYENFPKRYTEKYWTMHPRYLTTDWIGERVFHPKIEEVTSGYLARLEKPTHYITSVRYPTKGGYMSFAQSMASEMNVRYAHELKYISFKGQWLEFKNGVKHFYTELINTIPLPTLIKLSDAPEEIKKAAEKLSCSSVLLVNVVANHPTVKDFHWIYVYDEDKYCTRINCSERLSPFNAPSNQTAIQVEVYFSEKKPLSEDSETIAEKVCNELIQMGLILDHSLIIDYHTKWVQWANVIFDHDRKSALNEILDWLSFHGLERSDQDLLPATDWEAAKTSKGRLHLAGRFAEWKYYWTDDCVLRGKLLGERYHSNH